MKLQKHLSRKGKNGHNYFKWEIVIPEEIVKKAELEEGDDMEPVSIKKGEIKLVQKK